MQCVEYISSKTIALFAACMGKQVNQFIVAHFLPDVDINTLRSMQNCHHFADDIFKCILLNEHVWISINIPLKFFPKVRINNIPALVQIMAWRRPGDKPLSGPVMVRLMTHISVTLPQWVNVIFTDCGEKYLQTPTSQQWKWRLNIYVNKWWEF